MHVIVGKALVEQVEPLVRAGAPMLAERPLTLGEFRQLTADLSDDVPMGTTPGWITGIMDKPRSGLLILVREP